MFRSADGHPPGAAASAVAYLDERRARRVSSVRAQLEARDGAAARLREATLHYERHVLDWYAMGRPAQARAARAAIAGHEQALLAAQSALAAPAPRRERARPRPDRPRAPMWRVDRAAGTRESSASAE
jgi:hypothetical protein